MASLLVLKGANPGQRYQLTKPETLIGREGRDCDLVIPNQAVSRVHAQISQENGQFFIEDLKSRNKTYVNNKLVETRTALKENDRIKICDFLCTFHTGAPELAPLPNHFKTIHEPDDDGELPSTVQATIARVPQHQLLDTQPAERLRALLDVSTALSQTLELDDLLTKIVDVLLNTFRQADRCFIILRGESDQLIPKTVKARRPSDETPRFSKTIVRNCLETMQAFLSEDATSDNKFVMSQSITDFKIRSVMCVPLANNEGVAFGVVQLDTQDRSKKFTQDDLKLLMGVANQAAVAIDNARLHQDLILKERLQRDLEVAEQVQRSFLPSRLPDVPGYQFYAAYKSAMTIGGDYYDFIELPDKRLVTMVGDVAGKGIAAALLMAKLSAEGRYCMMTQPDPAKAIALLNECLMMAGMMDKFVTLAAAILDPLQHTVTFINAGHEIPLVYRGADNALVPVCSKDISGFALGMVDGSTYEAGVLQLNPGDTVLMFTDGVPDARNTDEKRFTFDGIRSCLHEDAAVGATMFTPAIIGRRLMEAVRMHASGRNQIDDIALVTFGRHDDTAPAGAPPGHHTAPLPKTAPPTA